MAVTVAATRTSSNFDSKTFDSHLALAFTGTYATGGFTWNPAAAVGTPGSSPLPAGKILGLQVFSLLGYQYPTTYSGKTATTKVLTALNTELAAGSAMPEPNLNARVSFTKFV